VHALVTGRGDLAAPAMEAASGLGPPPEMRALKTRRSGAAAATIVLAAIPDAAAPPGAGAAQLADPAFAAEVDVEFGAATTWTWQVREGRNAPVSVTLDDALLVGADTVSLSDGVIAAALRNAAGVTPAATIASTGGQERVDGARRMAAMLAGDNALPDFRDGDTTRPDINIEAATSMRARLVALIAVAGQLRARLGGAPTANDIAEAARWGLVADPVAAVATLTERIADATKATTGDTAALRRALRNLSGQAALPVLPTVAIATTAALPAALAPVAIVDGRPAIDKSWLEMVAAVRVPLARIEAHQVARELDGAPAWRAWSTNPADPWRPAGNDASLVMMYGPAGVIAAGVTRVALALLDRYAETIPSREHATAAAFGFNGPKSRAPQAVLLAVPPDLDTPLDAETLVAIVAETRSLARARAATPATLTALDLALPLPVLLATGPAAFDHNV
jgi:hypothetical protein